MTDDTRRQYQTVKCINPAWLNRQIGMRLLRLRKTRGLTQAQVGIALRVTRAAVANWELGNQNFVVTTLYDLARFYRVPVKRLLP